MIGVLCDLDLKWSATTVIHEKTAFAQHNVVTNIAIARPTAIHSSSLSATVLFFYHRKSGVVTASRERQTTLLPTILRHVPSSRM